MQDGAGLNEERGVRRINNSKIKYLLFMISVLLLGTNAGGQEQDDRAALQERHQALRKKVVMLKREQDFLLFQKEMYASDSKYLVLNLAEKSGQLKYKNRVLKGFRFISAKNFDGHALEPGALILTNKTKGKSNRFALIFGSALIVQWTRTTFLREGATIPTLLLREQDILSVFSAVEEGARAYIVP
jgi:hypothetical protein